MYKRQAATAIAYADASVARVALLTVFKVIYCCYRNCHDANCKYERIIASTRARQTATLPLLLLASFATIATTNALSLLRLPGDTATLPLLQLTSFAAAATAIAYADASVARVALFTVFKVICCWYRNCYAAIATPTSSFAIVATTNALSLLRVPGDTATVPLLLLTSFAAVATAFAYADASVCLLYTSPSPRD